MRRISSLFSLLALTGLFACIEPFTPDIDSNAASKYVVSGRISDREGWQEVSISLSSPVDNPAYVPVSGCQALVMDDRGNSFEMQEYNAGTYLVWMPQASLQHGTSFMLSVTLPDGDLIESSFEKLLPSPPLDSLYFIIEDEPTSDPGDNIKGLQYYVDLEAEGFEARGFKWEIEQTYEYHAAHPAQYFYNGSFNKIDPPDYSNMVCWSTSTINQVYTLSTENLARNSFQKYPLHFVDDRNPRLAIMYSILVSQYALTEEAFAYWDKVRINSHELGGLYEKQPLAINGNLVNISHPEKEVLGYFYAASVVSQRYFYKDIEGLELDFYNNCIESELGILGWAEFSPQDYPVYYYYSSEGLRTLSNGCVDCRLLGGTTVKPNFWPE